MNLRLCQLFRNKTIVCRHLFFEKSFLVAHIKRDYQESPTVRTKCNAKPSMWSISTKLHYTSVLFDSSHCYTLKYYLCVFVYITVYVRLLLLLNCLLSKWPWNANDLLATTNGGLAVLKWWLLSRPLMTFCCCSIIFSGSLACALFKCLDWLHSRDRNRLGDLLGRRRWRGPRVRFDHPSVFDAIANDDVFHWRTSSRSIYWIQ